MVIVSFFIGNDFRDATPAPRPRSYVYAFLKYLAASKPQGMPIHGGGRYDDGQPSFGPGRYLELERERCDIFQKNSPFLDQAVTAVHEDLAQIKRICDHKSLELLVVLIPDEMQVSRELQAEVVATYPGGAAGFDFNQANRRLRADLQALGIRHLDLLGSFEEAGRNNRLYKLRDTHWNIAGNRLAADLIRDELLRGDTKFWPRHER